MSSEMGKQYYNNTLQYARAKALPGLQGILQAPGWPELVNAAQVIFDHPGTSFERKTYYAAYMVRVRELNEHRADLKDDFSISTGRVPGHSDYDYYGSDWY